MLNHNFTSDLVNLDATFPIKIVRYFLLGSLFIALNAYSAPKSLHNFETTRLKSTAGAGVASILMDEASVLNPAPLAFFNVASIYVEKGGIDISSPREGGEFESDLLGVIASDTKGPYKGSFSYQKHSEFYNRRKKFSLAMGTPMGKKSGFGVAYGMTTDELSSDGNYYQVEKYKQFTFGVSHAVSEYFVLGVTAVDPFRVHPQDTRATLGTQYIYQSFLSVMLDMGADYNGNLSDTLLYKAAMQAKIYDDFYLRFGTFNDKGRMEKGNGAGVGWVQPRLVIEFAFKNTEVLEDIDQAREGQDIKETSISLSYRF